MTWAAVAGAWSLFFKRQLNQQPLNFVRAVNYHFAINTGREIKHRIQMQTWNERKVCSAWGFSVLSRYQSTGQDTLPFCSKPAVLASISSVAQNAVLPYCGYCIGDACWYIVLQLGCEHSVWLQFVGVCADVSPVNLLCENDMLVVIGRNGDAEGLKQKAWITNKKHQWEN